MNTLKPQNPEAYAELKQQLEVMRIEKRPEILRTVSHLSVVSRISCKTDSFFTGLLYRVTMHNDLRQLRWNLFPQFEESFSTFYKEGTKEQESLSTLLAHLRELRELESQVNDAFGDLIEGDHSPLYPEPKPNIFSALPCPHQMGRHFIVLNYGTGVNAVEHRTFGGELGRELQTEIKEYMEDLYPKIIKGRLVCIEETRMSVPQYVRIRSEPLFETRRKETKIVAKWIDAKAAHRRMREEKKESDRLQHRGVRCTYEMEFDGMREGFSTAVVGNTPQQAIDQAIDRIITEFLLSDEPCTVRVYQRKSTEYNEDDKRLHFADITIPAIGD